MLIVITADGYHINETCPYVHRMGVRKEGGSLSTDKVETRANICDSRYSYPFFSSALLSVPPLTRFSLLSLANSFPRDWVIDKCATITSTRTNTPAWITGRTDTMQEDSQKSQAGMEDWQTGRKSETLQWLPVTTFDWQLVGPSPFSSMRSLIKKQWQTTSGQKAAERSSIKLLMVVLRICTPDRDI